MEHEHLIPFFQRRYFPSVEASDDMLQAGRIGLFIASQKWVPAKGAFSTYAKYWVLRETTRYLRSRRVLLHRRGRAADKLIRPELISMDQPLAGEPDASYHDVVGTPAVQEEIAIENSEAARVAKAVSGLKPKQQQVVELWMQGKTLQQIGDEVGFTRERARQVFNDAKSVLAKKLAA